MIDNAQQIQTRLVQVPTAGVQLEGDLRIPASPRGLVAFAHGSGSSRFSRRNQFVAEALNRGDLATLLIDLLTREEERIDQRTAEFRFDIPLLADRLVGLADWLATQPELKNLPLGLFGASTGAAAALIAAAQRPQRVGAVVSRGGRPDLAGAALRDVECPTLLIVGGADEPVIDLNRQALSALRGVRELVIVPGATHLFEEPGALEQVAAHAQNWFHRHLAMAPVG